VGSWQSQSANIGRNCLPWQPTLAAQLLENGAKIEPYTIIIMLWRPARYPKSPFTDTCTVTLLKAVKSANITKEVAGKLTIIIIIVVKC
jgi:hypothetical protein